MPLICAGPGILPGRSVGLPVATLDIAGTFLDFAGILHAATAGRESPMTTMSLRGLLAGAPDAVARYRPFVSSGPGKWRMVVAQSPLSAGGSGGAATHPDAATYKLVCSNGSFWGPPSTLPQALRPGGDGDGGIFRVLYNISDDPSDMHEMSSYGTPAALRLVQTMLPLLPPAFVELCADAGENVPSSTIPL